MGWKSVKDFCNRVANEVLVRLLFPCEMWWLIDPSFSMSTCISSRFESDTIVMRHVRNSQLQGIFTEFLFRVLFQIRLWYPRIQRCVPQHLNETRLTVLRIYGGLNTCRQGPAQKIVSFLWKLHLHLDCQIPTMIEEGNADTVLLRCGGMHFGKGQNYSAACHGIKFPEWFTQ